MQALSPGSSGADKIYWVTHKYTLVGLYKHPGTQGKGITLPALTFIEPRSERLSEKSSIWLSVTGLFKALLWLCVVINMYVCVCVCVCVCVWCVYACNGGHDCSVPITSRAGMCIMINWWDHGPAWRSTVWDQTKLSLPPSPHLSFSLSLSLSLSPCTSCSLSQKPRMLTGDILHLWGQGCRGKHFPSLTLLQLLIALKKKLHLFIPTCTVYIESVQELQPQLQCTASTKKKTPADNCTSEWPLLKIIKKRHCNTSLKNLLSAAFRHDC